MALMEQIEDGAFVVTDPRFAAPTEPAGSDLPRWIKVVGFVAVLVLVLVVVLAWIRSER